MTGGSTAADRVLGEVLAFVLAAIVAGAGLYGGATDELGRVGLAALCGVLAAAAIAVPRVAEGTRVRRLAFAVGGLAVLALLQTVALPASLAERIAPFSFASRDVIAGAGEGVAASLDVDATRRAGVLLLALSVCLAAVAPRISARSASVLARCLALAAIGHAVIGLSVGPYQPRDTTIFGGFGVSNPWQAYGSFPNRAQFAAFETVLLGAACWLFAGTGRSVLDRALGVAAIGAVSTGVVASGSRAGVAGVVLSLAAAWVIPATGRRRARRALIVAGLVAAGVAAAVSRPDLVSGAVRGNEAARLDIWRGTIDLASRQPIVGVGVDAFRYSYAGDGRRPDDHLVSVAENDVLQAGAETGFIGLGLLSFGGLAIVRGWRSRVRTAVPSAVRSARLALAGPIGLLPLSMTSVPLHAPAVALAALAAGMLAVALFRDDADPQHPGYDPPPS